MKVPISKPYFDEHDFAMIQKPLATGWVVQGTYVKEFESRFAEFSGAPHAVAVSSCTTALHLAVAALGMGPGDEVIVPAFTWIATANAVEYLGAKPVFVDIDLHTYNLDPAQIERKITPRTKAIIPVHLFGLPVDVDSVMSLAKKHHLLVIEDAACAFGAHYHGRHVGTFGDLGCFSFHPRKAITTGEGGMLTTSSADLDTLLRSLRDHGASVSDKSRHESKTGFLLSEYNHLGYNFRMTDIQGALGVSQMQKAEWIQRRRAACAERYNELLGGTRGLRPPKAPADTVHGWQSYVCLFAPEEPSMRNCDDLHQRRNALMLALEHHGVSTRQGTHAVTLQNFYQKKYGIRDSDFPNACLADRLTIALPLYPQMTEEELRYVVATLTAELEKII